MNAAQIREAKDRFGKQLDMTDGPLDKAAIVERVAVGVLFEIAAQLADLNAKLEVDSLFDAFKTIGDRVDAMPDRRRS